jgi:hypothetical protein
MQIPKGMPISDEIDKRKTSFIFINLTFWTSIKNAIEKQTKAMRGAADLSPIKKLNIGIERIASPNPKTDLSKTEKNITIKTSKFCDPISISTKLSVA